MAESKQKSSVLILIILILISLSLAGGLFYLLQKEHKINLGLQQQLEEITLKEKITARELEESKKKLTTFEQKLKDAQAQIESLASDLEAEKAAKQEALGQAERISMELEQQKNLRLDLEKKFSQAEGDIKKSQGQLNELQIKKIELEARIQDLEAKPRDLEAKVQGVELGTIVVGPEAKKAQKETAKPAKESKAPKEKKKEAKRDKKELKKSEVKEVKDDLIAKEKEKEVAVPAPTLEGTVLVINKEYNFAVINLGSREGLKIGNVFSVYHKDKYIGDLNVEKVHESMSATGFLSPDIKDKINEGDRVVQKKK